MTTTNGLGLTRSWWAGQWLRALTRWMDLERLGRGRAYARLGQVHELTIDVGLIRASVQGTRRQPYEVNIALKTLSEQEWANVMDVLAAQAIHAAQLLNGEMPQNIEQLFGAAEVSLFPTKAGDLVTTCTCADPVNPCKHVAAVYYLVGEQLDQDPFLLLRMRGRTRAQIMASLRARRSDRLLGGGTPTDVPSVPAQVAVAGTTQAGGPPQASSPTSTGLGATELSASPDVFWRMGAELEGLQVRVAEPEIEMELVKILGDPAFVQSEELRARLEHIYRQVRAKAMETAFGDHPSRHRESLEEGGEL
jgi:uncharacterized Zn finger protein